MYHKDINVSTIQSGKSVDLVHSCLIIDEYKRKLRKDFLTVNGRFLVFPYYNDGLKTFYVTVYDLFCGKERVNSLPCDKMLRPSYMLAGNYLLVADGPCFYELQNLHIIKINYDDMSVEALEMIKFPDFFYMYHILPDQLGSPKFVVYNTRQTFFGEIQGDNILLNKAKSFGVPNEYKNNFVHTRLVGNSLQGFIHDTDGSSKFCEHNLDTQKTKETDATFILSEEDQDLVFSSENTYHWCWSTKVFYGFYEMQGRPNMLWSFNTETMKWFNVNIFVKNPQCLFVDENEIMTLQIGDFRNTRAIYRIALRTPDKLAKLVLMKPLFRWRFLKQMGIDKIVQQVQSLVL